MLRFFAKILFLEHCLCCHTPGNGLCKSCVDQIPKASRFENGICILYAYKDFVRQAIHNLKYRHKSSAAEVLLENNPYINEYIADTFHSSNIEDIAIVPIPLHARKKHTRGFNQSEVLAKILSRQLPHSTLAPVLVKTSHTLSQVQTHSKHERMKNIISSMKAIEKLNPRTIYIVIDDVVTTGATFAESFRALREAGAVNIISIALAH